MIERPRRNRLSDGIRSMVRETRLAPAQLVLPIFIQDGEDSATPVPSMPGCQRLGIDRAVLLAGEALRLGIRAVALFPRIPDKLKDDVASESSNPDGLLPRCVQALKAAWPQLTVITDVAMDPYSSDGHDGLVREGRIVNDDTLPILAEMAVTQARAGADVVAPSDMMDGRIAHIRRALDAEGFTDVLICSYCAKYASAFYGPFREALDSSPRPRAGIPGDKRSYQMDPANRREARREARLDAAEGADWLMVKPALPCLDIIADLRSEIDLPIAAYHVSGEYALLRAGAERGLIDYEQALVESLIAIRRAGADLVFTYGALDAAQLLNG